MTIDDMLRSIEDEAAAGLRALAAEIGDVREGRGEGSTIVDRIQKLAYAISDYRNIAGEDIQGVRLTKMLVAR